MKYWQTPGFVKEKIQLLLVRMPAVGPISLSPRPNFVSLSNFLMLKNQFRPTYSEFTSFSTEECLTSFSRILKRYQKKFGAKE